MIKGGPQPKLFRKVRHKRGKGQPRGGRNYGGVTERKPEARGTSGGWDYHPKKNWADLGAEGKTEGAANRGL